MNTSPKALIMAGGTGGHIFPGIALANALKAKGWQVSWIGTADRMEADIVPKHNIDINFIYVKIFNKIVHRENLFFGSRIPPQQC